MDSMRACLLGGGLVALLGFVAMWPASADDAFSANRKIDGSSRYTPSGFSSNNGRPTTSNSPLTTPQVRTTSAESSGPVSVMKRADDSGSKVQEIFPTAGAASSEPEVAAIPAADSPAQPTRGGLKSLQERFSSVRKLGQNRATPTVPPANNPVNATNGAPLVQGPQAGPMQPAAPTRIPISGPAASGPVPPSMPDIRMAQRVTVPSTASSGQPSAAPNAQSSDRNRATATVGGPVTSSRRMPSGQASGLPREDQGASAMSSVGPTPIGNESLSAGDFGGKLPTSIRTQPNQPPVRASAANAGGNVLFTRQSPILSVETAGPRSITIGKEATYVVSVTNSGDAAAQDVKVAIRIPPWTEVIGATGTSGAAQAVAGKSEEPLTWNVPRLESKGKEQLTLRLVPRESRPFDLAVQWTFSPVASQAMVEVKEPKLAMAVAGPEEILYGETKVYKLSLSNPGTGDAENVVLMLSPVDGGGGSPTRHEIGNIAAGENKLVEVELTARQAGTLAIKGTATADGSLRTEAAQQILVRRAGLKVATDGPELKFAGTVASFNIMVKNPGNATADSVQIAALLPTGAKYVSSTGGQFVAEEQKVVWTIPSLRSGGEQEFEVKCVLNSPGSNRMQVVALGASDLSDTTAMSTTVEALADLKLEVSDPTGPVAVGEMIAYEVRIKNRGTKAAENVAVHGFFSGGIEPKTAEGGMHELAPGQVVFKPIASIAPGAEITLKVQARAEQAGNHIFRAEVNCPAIGMKLAAEETTLFYGESGRAARLATKPADSPVPAQKPAESTDGGTSIVR
jgi:uncharacterized repeat protein (TIGR01451 family)